MKLKEIRQSQKLSIVRLSDITGIHRRTLEDVERTGKTTVATAIKLADALGVTLDELCRDTPPE